jgi:hypothetical protein
MSAWQTRGLGLCEPFVWSWVARFRADRQQPWQPAQPDLGLARAPEIETQVAEPVTILDYLLQLQIRHLPIPALLSRRLPTHRKICFASASMKLILAA